MATALLPEVDALDSRFLSKLRALKYQPKQRSALAAITVGAAARILAGGLPVLKFIEQVEYNGRRLAKLNLPPSAILAALLEYDGLLAQTLRGLAPGESANFQWVREQLHFCVILTLNNAYYQVREAETQAFYDLFRVELEAKNLQELLRRFVETLAEVCSADAAQLYLLNEDASAWMLQASLPAQQDGTAVPTDSRLKRTLSRQRYADRRTGVAKWVLDPDWSSHYESCWSIPLATEGRTAGVMQFGFKKIYEWLPREQDLLAAASERCLMSAEKTRLMEDLAAREEQIRRLAEHMLHVEEMERRRISRELHDEAGQSLLCIRLQMELLELSLPASEIGPKDKLREAREMTEHTILEMRRLIAALSPAVLEQLGLGAALRQLVNRFRRLHPCRVRLQLSRLGGLPQKTEIILYRLLQECFNNIGKHSSAAHVNISLSSADGRLKLLVEDNGVGFKVDEAFARRDSFGLSGMRERVALLGGKFRVESFPDGKGRDRGTKIRIELPISQEGRRRNGEPESMTSGRLLSRV